LIVSQFNHPGNKTNSLRRAIYKTHSELIEEKQRQGYEWIKKYGTNRNSASLFLNKIKLWFNEEFE